MYEKRLNYRITNVDDTTIVASELDIFHIVSYWVEECNASADEEWIEPKGIEDNLKFIKEHMGCKIEETTDYDENSYGVVADHVHAFEMYELLKR